MANKAQSPEEETGLERMAALVREASAAGRLVPLAEAAGAFLPEKAPEESIPRLLELLPDVGDVALVGEAEDTYLYSKAVMTTAYAHMAHRALVSDTAAVIAETVREESRLYPRPTPAAVFTVPPFHLEPAEVEAIVAQMAVDPRYADIRCITTSDGQRYLYSKRYLEDELAASLAEWYAVGQFASP